MQTKASFHPCLAAAAMVAVGFGVATPAHAQSCIWSYHAPPPTPFSSHAFVYHAGLQQVAAVETWRTGSGNVRISTWDGTTWTLLDDNGPPMRSGATVAYDSTRNRIIYFGGTGWQNTPPIGTTYPTDTWEWDGLTWTRVATAGPPGRQHHRMAYDESRQRTVLFGGFRQGYLGDIWEWDGQSWTLASTTGPSARVTQAFAYDSVRARTVLFGGTNYSGRHADLWEWDGAMWTERPGNAPDPEGAWMVFDPSRARMIVGRATETFPWSFRHETWEVDLAGAAAQWTLRDPGTAPWGPGAFDIARGRPVFHSEHTMEYHSSGTALSPYIVEGPDCEDCFVGSTAIITVEAAGDGPLSFQWRRYGQPLSDGGNISGATTDTLTLNPLRRQDTGGYDVIVSNFCGTIASPSVEVGDTCYANCDRSYVEPILNVDDFTCFIHEFAYALNLPHAEQITHYANCDGSATAPVLNVDDFTCFINAFAAGCP